jgi:F-type H+-transporting ATPase subunit b
MELDATTFLLEVVNFLVLLWLLTRFLYRPMRAALDARAQAAAQRAAELQQRSATLETRAADLQRQQRELQQRRESAEHDLAGEIARAREAQLAKLRREADDERAKAHARLDQELASAREQVSDTARRTASAFVADYLQRLASPELEGAIARLFLADLKEQSQAARLALREGLALHRDGTVVVDVATAHEAPAPLREQVEAPLRELLDTPVRLTWRIDEALLAGICVHLPAHQLEASLRRGIDAFAATAT